MLKQPVDTEEPNSPRVQTGTSDAELHEQLTRGDNGALGVLWHRYEPIVRRIIRRTLNERQNVDDLVQEVFLILLRRPEKVRQADALRAFFVGTAYRVAVHHARRGRLREWLSFADSLYESAAKQRFDSAERDRTVREAFEALPSEERAVLHLKYAEGFTTEQVAEALHSSRSGINRTLHKAKSRLLLKMSDNLQGAIPKLSEEPGQ